MKEFQPYIAGRMDYPDLPDFLRSQWEKIPPSHGAANNARPCMAVLDDNTVIDAVYVVSAEDFINTWGIWPKDDSAKREVHISRVRKFQKSPSRLPLKFAEKIYHVGESRMGGSDFTLVFSDKTTQAYVAGNAVDFLELPSGKSMADVIDVILSEAIQTTNCLHDLNYYWCLFGSGLDRRGGLTSRSS